MPKINKYAQEESLTGDEILLASKELNTGKTINILLKDVSDFIKINNGDFNGVVGLEDFPEGKTTGYWLANEIGVYENFGGVENIWTTGIITISNGEFMIKEFISLSNTLQYNDDFDI